jgi:4-nitrophenyl phosphatase
VKLVILDLDGTLYRGSAPVEGSRETVEELLRRGCIIRYLTNNSTAPPDASAAKLRSMGIPAESSWVVTSAIGAAWMLQGQVRRALVLGESGLVQALEAVGIEVELATEPASGQPVDAVVVGMCRWATYDALARCQGAILEGARFIATNRDATYPIENGRLIPGAGSLVAAVIAATAQEPQVAGKPEPFLIEHLMADVGATRDQTWMVGDRIDTDIDAARRAGTRSLLVLTGVTHETPVGYDGLVAPDIRGILPVTSPDSA